MKINFFRKQQGLNLIEVMLVLAVVTVMIVGGIRQFQFYRVENNIDIITTDVEILMDALKQFWFNTCNINTTDTPDTSGTYRYKNSGSSLLSDLVTGIGGDSNKSGGLSPTMQKRITTLGNPFSDDPTLFTGQYGRITTTVTTSTGTAVDVIPYIQLSAQFENASPAIQQAIARQTLGILSGNYITWRRLVQHSPSAKDLWILRSDLEQFRQYEDMSSNPVLVPPCSMGMTQPS